jgi:hypothetical protein
VCTATTSWRSPSWRDDFPVRRRREGSRRVDRGVGTLAPAVSQATSARWVRRTVRSVVVSGRYRAPVSAAYRHGPGGAVRSRRSPSAAEARRSATMSSRGRPAPSSISRSRGRSSGYCRIGTPGAPSRGAVPGSRRPWRGGSGRGPCSSPAAATASAAAGRRDARRPAAAGRWRRRPRRGAPEADRPWWVRPWPPPTRGQVIDTRPARTPARAGVAWHRATARLGRSPHPAPRDRTERTP